MSFVLESRVPQVWSYETRTESWYLLADGFLSWKWEGGPAPRAGLRASTAPDFAVPNNQITSLITVVEHVAEHAGLEVPSAKRFDQTVWTVVTDPADTGFVQDLVVLEGPVITYGVGTDLELCQAIELEYQHTAPLLIALRNALPALMPTGTDGGDSHILDSGLDGAR